MKEDIVPDLTAAQKMYREMMIHHENTSESKERRASETPETLYYIVSDEYAQYALNLMGVKY